MPSPARRLKGWTRKPPAWAVVDWQHPLARDLTYCLLFNQGGGTTLAGELGLPTGRGPITPTKTAITLSAGATWGFGALNFDDSVNAIVDLGSQNGLTGTNFTIISRVKMASDLADGELRTINGQNNSGGSEKILGSIYLEDIAGGGSVDQRFTYWRNDTARNLLSTTSPVSPQWYTVGLTVSGSAGVLYVDGVAENTSSTIPAAQTTANPGNLRVGFAGAFTGAPWSGLIDFWYLWYGRALSEREVRAVTTRPYAFILATPPKRRFGRASAAPGPTGAFNAAWCGNTNRVQSIGRM